MSIFIPIPALSVEQRLARVAGVLEGEGSFLTKSHRHSPVISCQMTDEDVITELHLFLGGSVCQSSVKNTDYKPVWVWTLQGEAAAEAMRKLYPYMFGRRKEAIDKALNTWYSRQNHLTTQKEKADKAARAWLVGEGSLRELATEYGVGYESIRRHAKDLAV